MCRSGTAAKHRRHTRLKRIVDLLRTDEMNMAVKATSGQYFTFACNNFGSGTNNYIDIGLSVGVSSLANRRDTASAQGNISLIDPCMIQDQSIGNNRIDGPCGAGDLRLAHAITDHFATPELNLFSIGRQIFFNLDKQVCISQADLITRCRAIHARIVMTIKINGHCYRSPMT